MRAVDKQTSGALPPRTHTQTHAIHTLAHTQPHAAVAAVVCCCLPPLFVTRDKEGQGGQGGQGASSPRHGPEEKQSGKTEKQQQGGKAENQAGWFSVLEHDAPRSEVLLVKVSAAADLEKVALGFEFASSGPMFGAMFGGGHVRPEAPFSVNGQIWEALFSVNGPIWEALVSENGPISPKLEAQWLRFALLL